MSKPEEITEEEYQSYMKKFFTRTFLPTPPYQFFIEYLETINELRTTDIPVYLPEYNEDAIQMMERFYKNVSEAGKQDINKELRIVEIEDDLIPIIENTDNKIFYRPLFFPTIFINNDFKFETFIVKGLLIQDAPNNKDLLTYMIGIDTNTYRMLTSTIILSSEKGEVYRSISDESKDNIDRLNHHIRLMICNIIDMVEGNDDDLDVTTIVTSPEQNVKRVKRGKVPFPTKVLIRANKEFKQYVKDFNDENDECKNTKLSCKFLVRGHWMHFRSDRYVRKQGEKTWIKPFYKGQGIVITKPYKVIK